MKKNSAGEILLHFQHNIFNIFFHRWRQLLGWRCHTVCSRPSLYLVGPLLEVSDRMRRTQHCAPTSSLWSEGTGNTGGRSSSRCWTSLMTVLWVNLCSSSRFIGHLSIPTAPINFETQSWQTLWNVLDPLAIVLWLWHDEFYTTKLFLNVYE